MSQFATAAHGLLWVNLKSLSEHHSYHSSLCETMLDIPYAAVVLESAGSLLTFQAQLDCTWIVLLLPKTSTCALSSTEYQPCARSFNLGCTIQTWGTSTCIYSGHTCQRSSHARRHKMDLIMDWLSPFTGQVENPDLQWRLLKMIRNYLKEEQRELFLSATI